MDVLVKIWQEGDNPVLIGQENSHYIIGWNDPEENQVLNIECMFQDRSIAKLKVDFAQSSFQNDVQFKDNDV